MSIVCPSCLTPLPASLGATSNSTKTACSACRAVFTVGEAKQHGDKSANPPPQPPRDHGGYQSNDDETKTCKFCKSTIVISASKCPHCQEWLTGPKADSHRYVEFHPGVAAVLTLFVPGLGQVYKTQLLLGFLIFCITAFGQLLSILSEWNPIVFLPTLIFHIVAIVDAVNSKPLKK